MTATKQRDYSFDIMKGIGIILMILGHYLTDKTLIRAYIFSFHMPMFFLISGYFFKEQPVSTLLKKDFRRLILPFLFVCLWQFANACFLRPADNFSEILSSMLKTFLWTLPIDRIIYGENITNIGPLWFIPAMFWCRFFFNALYQMLNKYLAVGIVLIFLIVISLNYINLKLPLALVPGCGAMLFYYLGYLIRNNKNQLQSIS